MADLHRERTHHTPNLLFPPPALLVFYLWPLGVSRLEKAGRSSDIGRSNFCDQHVRKVDKGCASTPKTILGL